MLVCMQDSIVLWDGRSSKDCRVGLIVPQELADAVRCVDCYSCIYGITYQGNFANTSSFSS